MIKHLRLPSLVRGALYGWFCLTMNGDLIGAELTGSTSPLSPVTESAPVSTSRRAALRLIHQETDGGAIDSEATPLDLRARPPEDAVPRLEGFEVSYAAGENTTNEPLEQTSDGRLKMKPFVTGVAKLPDLTPPRENKAEEFIRTGTISQHVGKKVTTRLWMKGDEGIMLRFSW